MWLNIEKGASDFEIVYRSKPSVRESCSRRSFYLVESMWVLYNCSNIVITQPTEISVKEKSIDVKKSHYKKPP